MYGPRDYHTKRSKLVEKDKCHTRSLICGILKKNDKSELICKKETDSQI